MRQSKFSSFVWCHVGYLLLAVAGSGASHVVFSVRSAKMLLEAFRTGKLQMKKYLEVCVAFSGHIQKVLACLTSKNGQRVKFPEV